MAAQSDANRKTDVFSSMRKSALGIFVLNLCLQLPAQVKQTQVNQSKMGSVEQAPKTAPATDLALSSYEGQNVTSIEIAGRPELNVSQFAPLFAQRAGEPFSTQKIEQTIAAIKAAGKFAEVQLQVHPEATGVQVLLVLEPAFYFGVFEFPGAEQFSYSRLVQVANYPPEAPFNPDDIQQDQNSLLTFFRQQGFFQAEVHPEVKVDALHGIADVVFHVALKRQAKFGEIKIAGATSQEAAELTHSLHSLMARARGSAIRTGKNYRRKTITNATRYLQSEIGKTRKAGRTGEIGRS